MSHIEHIIAHLIGASYRCHTQFPMTRQLESVIQKAAEKGLWRSEIPFFGVELVILKSEKRKLGTIFVAIGRFFENQHILNLAGSRRTHDSFNLRFRHAGGHLVIIVYG